MTSTRRTLAAALLLALLVPSCREDGRGGRALAASPSSPGSAAAGSTNGDEPLRAASSASFFPWESRAPLAFPLTETVLEDWQGRVFAFGGDTGGAVSGDIVAYDPAADAWSRVGSLSFPRAGATAARLGSVIYVIGGHDGTAALASVETFDAATGAVGGAAPLAEARNHAACAIEDGRIYVFGGTPDPTGSIARVIASAEVYDPAADRWSPIRPLPVPLWGLMGTSVSGLVYLVGGHDATAGGAAARNEAYAYDPRTDAYTPRAPAFARRHGGVALPYDGRIYVIGGTYTIPGWQPMPDGDPPGDAQYETSLVEVYDVAADRWSSRLPMLTARTMLGGTMAAGFAYLVGGHALDLSGGLGDGGGPGGAGAGSGGEASVASGPVPAGARTPTAAVERFDPISGTLTPAARPSGGSGGPVASGEYNVTVASSGAGRLYRVYVPTGYSNATSHPVVILLHGTNTDVTVDMDLPRFEVQADRDGVLLVKPQGVATLGPAFPPIYAPGYPSPIVSIWPLGLAPVPGETHVPDYPQDIAGGPATTWEMHDWQPDVNLDYRFVLDVVADVAARYNVDRARVYQVGQSGGALMTSTVGPHHGEFYAACASISGGDIVAAYAGTARSFLGVLSGWPPGLGPQGPTPDLVRQAGSRRTPFLFIHGAADGVVPPAGSTELAREMRRCGWHESDSEVHLLPNGSHVWFTLNEEIWAFLMAHALP